MIADVATALYDFFSGFGLSVYTTNNVPQDAALPYITYDLTIGRPLTSAPLGARLWYEGQLPVEMLQKADEIHEALKYGVQIKAGNGFITLYEGEPFAQVVADEDERISTLYLNVTANYDLN